MWGVYIIKRSCTENLSITMEEKPLINIQVLWENRYNRSDEATAAILGRLYQMLVELFINRKPDSVSLISKDSLLQIWVPKANDDTLSAKDSPYGIAYEKEGGSSSQLPLYRKESSQIGVNKYITNRSSKFSNQANFLHYQLAKRFGIQASKVLPIFDLYSPTPSSCIAVLELVTTKKDPDFAIEEYREIKRELEKINLATSYSGRHYFMEEPVAQGGLLPSLMANKVDEVYGVSSTNSNSVLLQKTPTVCARLPIVGKISTCNNQGVKVDAPGFKLDDEATSHQQQVQEMEGWRRS
ncbi:protein NLP3-like [Solanum stenotomum]|uniref:protein NLP3-like n=1 Tax=Solanum stenotomum TaxID=172797 RepID=UPI0020D1CF17|nr:protein NLP3-like [Solanum stenotomum]